MQIVAQKASHLSIQQMRTWHLQQESQMYSTQCMLLLEGVLDREALQSSLQHMLSRHEILRTVFYQSPDMDIPLQAIANSTEQFLPLISLEDTQTPCQDKEVERLFESLKRHTFDLAHGPLLHLWLLRLASDKHLLLLRLPALCADTTTLSLLFAELCQSYAAHIAGETFANDLLQYADVSAWLQKLLKSDDAEDHLAYWHKFDLSRLDSLSLPFRLSEIAGQADQKHLSDPYIHELSIEATLSTHLYEQAQLIGVSPEAWILACWKLLLWRLTNEDDMLIGLACDGREYEELAAAPGPYTRFVPFGMHIAGDWPFLRIVDQVNKALDEAREEQEYFTWDRLSQASSSPTNLPFFPLSFQWQDWPETLHAPGLRFSLLRCWDCYEPFALKLQALSIGQNLRLVLHADPTLLTPSHLQHLGSALLCLLQASLAHPHHLLGQFPLLSPPQQDHLLQRLHGPALPLPVSTIAQLFAQQAHLHPQRPALVCGTTQFRYQQLDALSNQLAHTLRHHGVHANVLVALCMPRSADMLIALLAVLKAGGA